VTRHQVIWLDSGHRVIWQGSGLRVNRHDSGTGSGTGSSGSDSGHRVTWPNRGIRFIIWVVGIMATAEASGQVASG
ncbi:unnamed protein product, partial [Staurois parvus]